MCKWKNLTLAFALLLTGLCLSTAAQTAKTTCYDFQGSQTAAGTATTGSKFVTYSGKVTDAMLNVDIASFTATVNYDPATGNVTGGTYTVTTSGLFGVAPSFSGTIPAEGRLPLNGDGTLTSRTITLPLRGDHGFVSDLFPANGALTATVTMDGRTQPPTVAARGNLCVSTAAVPIDKIQNFVARHYQDFLNRAPDSKGLAFWIDQIASCGSDQRCAEVRTINVSAAYFLSIEFQETGYLVYRLYQESFGRRPTFSEFMPDTRTISQGVVIGAGGWEAQLEANKVAFVNNFATRLPDLTPEQYVDRLNANTGGTLSQAERDGLANGLRNGTETRASVLRKVAENRMFFNREFNRAFVLMQYFGYLRREPDEAGFNFWLGKLNQFNGNFVEAEMVKAFIVSGEYQSRFAQP